MAACTEVIAQIVTVCRSVPVTMALQAVWDWSEQALPIGEAHAVEEGQITALCGQVVLGSLVWDWPPLGRSRCYMCSRAADRAAGAPLDATFSGTGHLWLIDSWLALGRAVHNARCPSCRWSGPARSSEDEADEDGREHVGQAAAQPDLL